MNLTRLGFHYIAVMIVVLKGNEIKINHIDSHHRQPLLHTLALYNIGVHK